MTETAPATSTTAAPEPPPFMTGRIPFWAAVGITAVVSLPLGLYLGKLDLPLWVAFIVWGQYFAMGGSPRVLVKILPNFIAGAVWTGLGTLLYVWLLSRAIISDPTANSLFALGVALFVTLGILVWAMRFGWPFANEALPLFQGATLLLAVDFTGKAWPLSTDPYFTVALAAATTVVAGVAGGLLGWFNEVITFPAGRR